MPASPGTTTSGHTLSRPDAFPILVGGAELQPDGPFGILGARGQQDDGNAARLAQVAGQRQSVLARHHDVADDQVDALRAQDRARLGGTRRRAHCKALRLEIFAPRFEIGRASCRERVCQYVYISVVAVSLKKTKTK